MQDAWIINTGSELLTGITVNTNAAWLSRKLTFLGYNVKRIIIVADEFQEFSEELKRALDKKVKIIITTGGLGPTYDDSTSSYIAKTLGLKFLVNKEAYEMVKEKYERLGVPLTPERIKMAYLPEGAIPLKNRVGIAPGVLLKHNDSYIIALPGVPSEMKAIFEECVEPLLKEQSNRIVVEELVLVKNVMESSLAPIISKLAKKYQNVYIKSHPKGEESSSPKIEIQILASGPKDVDLSTIMKSIKDELVDEIKHSFRDAEIE